ncbi:hypothetical protein HDU98_005393, partial [Podochytrium sp. JEL0797]
MHCQHPMFKLHNQCLMTKSNNQHLFHHKSQTQSLMNKSNNQHLMLLQHPHSNKNPAQPQVLQNPQHPPIISGQVLKHHMILHFLVMV